MTLTYQQRTPFSSLRVVGRYVLLDRIGAGGMANVHLGRLLDSAGTAMPVAIKCVSARHAEETEFRTMLIDEARLSARVCHPNVVATRDVIITGDEVMLVLEYVAGETLYRLLTAATEREEPVPVPVAVRVGIDMLRGLQAAHDATDESGQLLHLVHRDVSPQNVMVGVDGASRLLDFGIAKARGRLLSTRDGGLKGKLGYMAPEQVRGAPVSQTDVFAAAVVLWEMLTGKRLFEGADEGATLNRVLNEPIQPPSSMRSSVPPGVEDVVMRGLSRDLDQRFGSASAMADALASAAQVAGSPWVAQWVRGLVSERLDHREMLVNRMWLLPANQLSLATWEQPFEEAVTQISVPSIASQAAQSAMNGSMRENVAPTSARWPWVFLAAGMIFAAVAVGALLHASGRDAGSSTSKRFDLLTAQDDAGASSHPLDRHDAQVAASDPVASGPVAPAVSALADPQPSAPKETSPSRTTRPYVPRGRPTAPATTHGKPKCDNPTYVDEKGIRRYRVECL